MACSSGVGGDLFTRTLIFTVDKVVADLHNPRLA